MLESNSGRMKTVELFRDFLRLRVLTSDLQFFLACLDLHCSHSSPDFGFSLRAS